MSMYIWIACVFSMVALSASAVYQTPTYSAKRKTISRYQVLIGREKNQEIKEKLIIDTKKQTETFIVPKYRGNNAAVVLGDFNKGLKLIYNKDKNACYLTRLLKDEEPPRVLKAIIDREVNMKKVLKSSHKVEEKHVSTWKIGKLLNDTDKTRFSKAMKKLCGKKQVFWLTKAKGSIIYHGIVQTAHKRDGPQHSCYSQICTTISYTVYVFEPTFHTVTVNKLRCILVIC